MKIILSRKGFDLSSGGMASPILPDGTLLSLPIPDKNSQLRFADISYHNKTYQQIIQELNPNFTEEFCHLDPDIRPNCRNNCPAGWFPAFGQRSAALTHLRNYNVDIGDWFIFFGWFRQTKLNDKGKLTFVGPDKHIIYGFMEVGNIIKGTKEITARCPWHPHAHPQKPLDLSSDDNNWLFIPQDKKCKIFNYAEKRVLTQEGLARSQWNLPAFFRESKISYHSPDSWKTDYFQSVPRGQEFVISQPTSKIIDWILNIISD